MTDALGSLGTLAAAVYKKYESVKTLKSECRRARDIAEAVRTLATELEAELAHKPNPPALGNPIKMLRSGLEEAGEVLDVCATRPLQVRVCSATYISKLQAAVSKMLEGIQLLSGANVGLSLDMQDQLSDVKDTMATVRSKLDGFVDDVGDEMRRVVRENNNEVADVVCARMIEFLERDRLAVDRADAERQLRLLAEEQDRVRREKTFNREMEEELLQAVCALSLMGSHSESEPPERSGAVGPPDDFTCPISLEVMDDPVMVTQSGITYERAYIEEALRTNPCRDPKTNQEWSSPLTIAPNVLVRKMIREWQESGHAPPPRRQSPSPPQQRSRQLSKQPAGQPSNESTRLQSGPSSSGQFQALEQISKAELEAFLEKVGSSINELEGAVEMDWSSKSLTGADCKVIAHLAASGAMPNLETLEYAQPLLSTVNSLSRTQCSLSMCSLSESVNSR